MKLPMILSLWVLSQCLLSNQFEAKRTSKHSPTTERSSNLMTHSTARSDCDPLDLQCVQIWSQALRNLQDSVLNSTNAISNTNSQDSKDTSMTWLNATANQLAFETSTLDRNVSLLSLTTIPHTLKLIDFLQRNATSILENQSSLGDRLSVDLTNLNEAHHELLNASLNQTSLLAVFEATLNSTKLGSKESLSDVQDALTKLNNTQTSLFQQKMKVRQQTDPRERRQTANVMPNLVTIVTSAQEHLRETLAFNESISSVCAVLNELNSSFEDFEQLQREGTKDVADSQQMIANATKSTTAIEEMHNVGSETSHMVASQLTSLEVAVHHAQLYFQLANKRYEESKNMETRLQYHFEQEENYRQELSVLSGATATLIDHTLMLFDQTDIIQQLWFESSEVNEDTRLELLNSSVDDVTAVLSKLTAVPPLNEDSLSGVLEVNSGLLKRMQLLANMTLMGFNNNSTFEETSSQISALNSSIDRLGSILTDFSNDLSKAQSEHQGNRAHFDVLLAETTSLIGSIGRNVNVTKNLELDVGFVRNRLDEIPSIVLQSSGLFTEASSKFLDLFLNRLLLVEIQSSEVNKSLSELEEVIANNSVSLPKAERAARTALRYLDEIPLAVCFSNNSQRMLSFLPFLSEQSNEFRSASFFLKTDKEIPDSVVLHLTDIGSSGVQNISLTIGVLNRRMAATFLSTHSFAGSDITNLTVTSRRLRTEQRYFVAVTRTDQNVHLFLHEERTERTHTSSESTSLRLAFSLRTWFSARTHLSVGGRSTTFSTKSTPFAKAGDFVGCVGDVTVNDDTVDLWSIAADTRLIGPLQACPISSTTEITRNFLLAYDGDIYSEISVLDNGEILPLQLNFRTSLQNGLLVYATHSDKVSSLQISLTYGYIVVKVTANNGKTRSLTSSFTYGDGTNHILNLSLSRSQRTLILTTDRERTSKGLQFIPSSEVKNFTDIFVGGAPRTEGEELKVSNISGCLGFSTVAEIDPLPFQCTTGDEMRPCPTCSDEPLLSASFYGDGYARFPPVEAGEIFDLELSFRTIFPDALLIYSGNASQRLWFSLTLQGGRLQLTFGSLFGNIALSARSLMLNDDLWHTIVLVRSQSELNILLDHINVGSFPFGSFFPTGLFSSSLFIGGIPHSLFDIIQPGITTEGFKGCIDNFRVLGQRLDYLESVDTHNLNFEVCRIESENEQLDVYSFDGTGSAEYDLGRFEPDFSLGFQFRSVSLSGLLLYIFSRRREDYFAVQLRDGHIGFSTWSDQLSNGEMGIIAESSNRTVTDGEWHAVVVEKIGKIITMGVDKETVAETSEASDNIRSNSELFIGGIPNGTRITLPDEVTSNRFKGCLRMQYLTHSKLTGGVQENNCEIDSRVVIGFGNQT